MPQLPLLALLLVLASTQSNVCYANCKKGYCASNNSNLCSDCDLGTLNIDGSCLSSNIQPSPIVYYKPNKNNTLLDANFFLVQFCDISGPNILTRMLFQPQIGNSYTQQFTIPTDYSYLHIKFNAILLTSSPVTQSLSILTNLVPANNRRAFILSKTESIAANGLTLSCNGTIKNIKNYYGVFFSDYKTSDNNKSIILEVIPQGLVGAYIAVSSIELYYGNCDRTCATCLGPTNTQCSSCKGLLLTLKNSTCLDCPEGFYQNVTCFPCPPLCQTCSYSASTKKISCLSCKPVSSLQFTLSNGNCELVQFYTSTLSEAQKVFDFTNWTSSEVAFSPISYCGNYKVFGGLVIGVANSQLSYQISELPAHSTVYVYYRLFLVDQTPSDIYQYQLIFDSISRDINFTIPSANVTNECGGDQVDFVKAENHSFPHNATTAKLTIEIYQSYLGIRDFVFIVDNPTTDPNCLIYNSTTKQCTLCRNALVLLNSTCSVCIDGFYLAPATKTLRCQACHFTCLTCKLVNGDLDCVTCRTPLILDNGYCVDANQNLFNAEVLTNFPLATQKLNYVNYPNLQKKGVDFCGQEQILGTTTIKSKFLNMSRVFSNLPPHTGAVLYFMLYQIDDNYFPNNSLSFTFNSKTYTQDNLTNISQYANIKLQICGNSSWDSKFVVTLKDDLHTASTLDFTLNVNRMAKIGFNNVQLYLLNSTTTSATSYKVDLVPSYSINTPPRKGIQVKITFNSDFVNISDLNSAFEFIIANTSARLLQESSTNPLVTTNTSYSNRQLFYQLNLTEDYNDGQQLQVRATSQKSVYFGSGAGEYTLISQTVVSTPMTRYVNIDQNSVNDRSSMRNLYNLFRGCAILGLFIGMGSFLFGMSAAFDDFFLLCQLIFVHVFIQLSYNPPSLLIPFSGLHIVQFLEWLPQQARAAIQDGIIPQTLYQDTPLVFQQFFKDTVFARTIYHTIIYFGLILGLWLVMHTCLLIYESKFPDEKVKFQNFFVFYYKQYDNKKMVFVDKMVRFAYFTIVWACILQFLSFTNSPSSFRTWNSALTVIMFAFAIVYPLVMYYLLRSNADSLTNSTFGLAFQELRVDQQNLYYYVLRYYKLLVIGIVVAVSYNWSPVVPLIVLMGVNGVQAAVLMKMKPLGMMQAQVIQATVFYPWYPRLYHITTIIQQFLFIVMQILFLGMVGIRSKGSSSAYMGLGYAVCAFAILLLLNGLVRLVWGVLKILQFCYLEREANYLSVEKDIEDDPPLANPVLTDGRTQTMLSRAILNPPRSRVQTKQKISHVSRIR